MLLKYQPHQMPRNHRKPKRKYSASFKESTIKEFLKSGQTAKEFSKQIETPYFTFNVWLDKYFAELEIGN